MAHLIKSSVEYVNHDGNNTYNAPINLDHVLHIQRGFTNIKPYKSEFFVIKFDFIDREILWCYKTQEERNYDYERIVNNKI